MYDVRCDVLNCQVFCTASASVQRTSIFCRKKELGTASTWRWRACSWRKVFIEASACVDERLRDEMTCIACGICVSTLTYITLATLSHFTALETFQHIPTSTAARHEANTHYHVGSLHHCLWSRAAACAGDAGGASVASELGEHHLELTMNHYR